MVYSSFQEDEQPKEQSVEEYVPFSRPLSGPMSHSSQNIVVQPSRPQPQKCSAAASDVAYPITSPVARPTVKSIVVPPLIYIAVFFELLIVGSFLPEGSFPSQAMMIFLTAMILVAPIFFIVVIVRFFYKRHSYKKGL